MLSGAAFAIMLFVAAQLMLGSEPDTSSKDSAATIAQKWEAVIDSSSHRNKILAGTFLTVLSSLALLWFANTIRNRYAPSGSPLMAFTTLAAVGRAGSAIGPLVLVGGHAFGNEALPTDGNVMWATASLSMPLLLVVYGFALAATLATSAVAARASLPRWLLVFTWVAVIASLASVTFSPMLLALVYLLVVGIWGALETSEARRTAATLAPAAA